MRAMKTIYPQPGLTLDYAVSGALDRFGRVVDHARKKNSNDVMRIQHGYDRASNRLSRTDLVHANNSETYTYDGVNQIKSLNRTGHAESWDYDTTGNWLTYDRNSVVENRTHIYNYVRCERCVHPLHSLSNCGTMRSSWIMHTTHQQSYNDRSARVPTDGDRAGVPAK